VQLKNPDQKFWVYFPLNFPAQNIKHVDTAAKYHADQSEPIMCIM